MKSCEKCKHCIFKDLFYHTCEVFEDTVHNHYRAIFCRCYEERKS